MSKRSLITGQVTALAALVAAAVWTSRTPDWEPVELTLALSALAIGCHLFPLDAPGVRISGSFMGLVLAMALLGPAPAVAMGVACASVDVIRGRSDHSDEGGAPGHVRPPRRRAGPSAGA